MSLEQFQNETKNYHETRKQWYKFAGLASKISPNSRTKEELSEYDFSVLGANVSFSFEFIPGKDKPGKGRIAFLKDSKYYYHWYLDAAGRVTYDADKVPMVKEELMFELNDTDEKLGKDTIAKMFMAVARWDGKPRN